MGTESKLTREDADSTTGGVDRRVGGASVCIDDRDGREESNNQLHCRKGCWDERLMRLVRVRSE